MLCDAFKTPHQAHRSDIKVRPCLVPLLNHFIDFIHIARAFNTVLLSNVPVLSDNDADSARRFVNMIDEFYDRNVKLLVSADAPARELYRGRKLDFEFQRTVSRLVEMQSREYLARPHLS